MDIIKVGSKFSTFGLNYYCGKTVTYDKSERLRFRYIIKEESLTNDLGWPITIPPTYGEGLYDMLNQVYHSYKNFGLKKIYITENGMAQNTTWDGKEQIIEDQRRVYYFNEHLKQIHKAIQRGIPVHGYFAWTLLDNYEWAEGYRPESCFGLVHVDRKTLKRIPKKSYHWYKKLIRVNKEDKLFS